MTNERGDLLRGTLEMLILRTLEEEPMHGYGITERLLTVSPEFLSVDEGSLYPALYRMQKRGWVTSKWGKSENNRKARFYKLTKSGRKQLRVESEQCDRLAGAVTRVMDAN